MQLNTQSEKLVNSIKPRLIFWVLLLSLAPLILVSLLNFSTARKGLIQAAQLHLDSVAQENVAFIDNWFAFRQRDIEYQAAKPTNSFFLQLLEFGLERSDYSAKDYVHTEDWRKRVKRQGEALRAFKQRYDYIYDIRLISANGNILYSLLEAPDMGLSLNSEPLIDSQLTHAFLKSLQSNKAQFTDFERYHNNQLVSAFITAPMRDEQGKITGVIAFQIRSEFISSLLESEEKQHVKHYLVGRDGFLRSTLSGTGEDILTRRIVIPAVEAWQQSLVATELSMNQSLAVEYIGSEGKAVIGEFTPLHVYGVNWLLVSEKNKRRALAPVYSLAQSSILLLLFTAICVVTIALMLIRQIVAPLQELAAVAKHVASGQRDAKAQVHKNDEIGMLATAFNTMLDNRYKYEQDLTRAMKEATAASVAKSDFLASMSHEIRTPMNGVLGMLGLLKREQLQQEQLRKIEVAYSSAQSLLSLLNDILDFSKVEAGSLNLELVDFSPYEQLVDVIHLFSLSASQKSIELILDANDISELSVKGDPSRFRQVLSNLVGNAIKFTEAGEVSVCVDIDRNKSILKCSVIDTGIGINKAQQEDLFKSFTQLDGSSTRKHGGSGLGLAMCKKLTQLMGGDISVSSEEHKGSTFSFNIQVTDIKSRDNSHKLATAGIQDLNILVVDDISLNREIFISQLQSWGINAKERDAGMSALSMLQQNNAWLPDIILLDYQMPGMDGLEFCKALRKALPEHSIKLLLLSSASNVMDHVDIEALGFSGCLIKPVMPSDLFSAICALKLGPATDNSFVNASYLASLPRPAERVLDQTELEQSLINDFSGHCNVLVVEDNAINQEVISAMLMDLGVEHNVVSNGEQALQALKADHNDIYDLVFMDCQMPIMDGYQATKDIRSGEAGSNKKSIPVIAMTANAMKGDRERCLASGMDDYVSKPISHERVIAMLNKWKDVDAEPEGEASIGMNLENTAQLAAVPAERTEPEVTEVNATEANAITVEPLPEQDTVIGKASFSSRVTSDEQETQPKARTKRRQKEQVPLVLPETLRTIDFSVKKPDIARRSSSYLKVLNTYIRQNEDFVQQISNFFNAGDWAELKERVHAIKGASGNLGMMPLFELAANVEAQLRNQETLQVHIFDSLIMLIEQSLNDAKAIIHANNSKENPQSSRPYSELVAELKHKLMVSEAVSPALVEGFRCSARTVLAEDKIKEIVNALDSFDYDEALEMLATED